MHKPELKEIPIDKLKHGQYQPRRQFKPDELAELAQSIASSGLIQPVVVRPLTEDLYEIVAGERRFRAAQLAQLQVIPCLINHYNDEQTAAITTIENINRVDLNPIEEANAYQRLADEFGYSHEELAMLVGKSRTKITNTLRLLKLDDRVQALLRDGHLSEGHGKIIAGLPHAQQYPLANQCTVHDLSIRQTENEIKKMLGNSHPPQHRDPDVKVLEHALSDHLGCKITIDVSNNHCKLHMDCHSLEILQGVLEKIGVKPP